MRFGVAMDASLVAQLDRLAAARGCNRSELLRDLARAEVGRVALDNQALAAFAAITLVYNHHARELQERLNRVLTGLEEQVYSAMHVHIDRSHSLEMIALRGSAKELKQAANRMIGIRGVLQGAVEYVSRDTLDLTAAGCSARNT